MKALSGDNEIIITIKAKLPSAGQGNWRKTGLPSSLSLNVQVRFWYPKPTFENPKIGEKLFELSLSWLANATAVSLLPYPFPKAEMEACFLWGATDPWEKSVRGLSWWWVRTRWTRQIVSLFLSFCNLIIPKSQASCPDDVFDDDERHVKLGYCTCKFLPVSLKRFDNPDGCQN